MPKSSFFANLLPVDHCQFSIQDGISENQLLLLEYKVAQFFGKAHASFMGSGREAISMVLNKLNLSLDDEVYITTSFNYKNVSSCVTSTIFNYCKPSRVISKKTKAIFIIHEFGVFHPDTLSLIKFGKDNNIPVIEDCAHSPFSFDSNSNQTGKLADFTIVSLPKIFPVDIGGILVYGNNDLSFEVKHTDKHLQVANIANQLWDRIDDISQKRKNIFNVYLAYLKSVYCKPLIDSSCNIFPWFFPIVTELDQVKTVQKLRANGIEAGLWHGSKVVILPLHQYLNVEIVIKACNIINKSLSGD